jgi:hypothetical protein
MLCSLDIVMNTLLHTHCCLCLSHWVHAAIGEVSDLLSLKCSPHWSLGVYLASSYRIRLFNVFTVHTSRCISVGALVVARLRDTTVAVVAHFMGSLCLLASYS